MTPEQYCQSRAAGSGSSFYYSFLVLPGDKRAAITAFYAFCREVDDIVDETSDIEQARSRLDDWRRELDRLYAGVPTHPVGQALLPQVSRFGIARESLEDIIDGMAMDLGPVRYPDFKQLRLYCHRVAGVVGEVAATLFGYQDHATLRYAARLGLAFQLTNILRDVGEDARRGRIYLPLDELAAHGVSEAELLAGSEGPGFQSLMRFQYQRASDTYTEALALLPEIDRHAQRPGLMMAAIYRDLLDSLRDQGFPVLRRRVSLSTPRKLWLAGKTWLAG